MPAATDPALKAQIIGALLAGGAVSDLARKYNLNKSTVSRIKASLASNELQQVATEKRDRIDDLILKTVATNLAALQHIAEFASEREYIQQQPAEAIAVLYGQVANTSIRILEAASAAGIGEESPGAA